MQPDRFELDGYSLVAAGSYGSGKKVGIGAKDNCRFCGRSSPDTSFKNEAHAIPEFLGNHQLIILSECDYCNKHFSKTLEHDLDKYTAPFRSTGGVTNKSRKTPKHKDRNIKSLHFDRHTNNLAISMNSEDAARHDWVNKHATWIIERRPFIPRNVHKALCKIALSVIENPSLLPIFQPTLQWINPFNTEELRLEPALVVETIVPGTRSESCNYMLHVRSNGVFPHALFWIEFGNHTLQTIVPTIYDFQPNCIMTSSIPLVEDARTPEQVARFGPLGHVERDFSSSEPLILPHELHMRFESVEEIPGPMQHAEEAPHAAQPQEAPKPGDPTRRKP